MLELNINNYTNYPSLPGYDSSIWQKVTNAFAPTAGVGGSYSTNSFTDIFTVANTVGTTTNHLDVGGATNVPARYYRVRLVP